MALSPTPAPCRRRLSDADLLHAEFHYSDPENSIPGLNRGVPDPDAHPVIIGYYNEKPPGGRKANPDHPLVWCCHCRKPTHWDGRVVSDDHGQTYIIGAKGCGKQHYGDRFGEAERLFRDERQRRVIIRRWRNAYPLVAGLQAEVAELLAWPGLQQLELKREEIRSASKGGYDKLIRYCSTGMEMVAHRSERDFEAEAKRAQRYQAALAAYKRLKPAERIALRDAGEDPQIDNDPIIRKTEERLGFVTGGDFLHMDRDPRTLARSLAEVLTAMAAIGPDDTDEVDSSELSAWLKAMSDRVSALRSQLYSVGFSHLFFSPDNLRRLARWSDQEARFGYSFDEELRLLIRDSSRGHKLVDPIADLTPPIGRTIDSLRFLDEDFAVSEDLAA